MADLEHLVRCGELLAASDETAPDTAELVDELREEIAAAVEQTRSHAYRRGHNHGYHTGRGR